MTCTIITPGRVHPRMQLAPAPPLYDAWLDPHPEDPDDLRALLITSAASTPRSLRTRRAWEPGLVAITASSCGVVTATGAQVGERSVASCSAPARAARASARD
jgi:hypothetical protein